MHEQPKIEAYLYLEKKKGWKQTGIRPRIKIKRRKSSGAKRTVNSTEINQSIEGFLWNAAPSREFRKQSQPDKNSRVAKKKKSPPVRMDLQTKRKRERAETTREICICKYLQADPNQDAATQGGGMRPRGPRPSLLAGGGPAQRGEASSATGRRGGQDEARPARSPEPPRARRRERRRWRWRWLRLRRSEEREMAREERRGRGKERNRRWRDSLVHFFLLGFSLFSKLTSLSVTPTLLRVHYSQICTPSFVTRF